MSIHKLMADQRAASIFAEIPADTAPAILADEYLQAKLAGRVSACAALEAHIRILATQHFNRLDVLEALRKMERYKAMRKPGTRAPAMLQDIAAEIESRYSRGNYAKLPSGRIQFHLECGLKITCENMPGAVALVCAKYRRGLPRRNWKAS